MVHQLLLGFFFLTSPVYEERKQNIQQRAGDFGAFGVGIQETYATRDSRYAT